MAKLLSISIFLFLGIIAAGAQDLSVSAYPDASDALTPAAETVKVPFDKFFEDHTLRIDYLLAGKYEEAHAYLWQIKEEPMWGGPHKNLLDPWNSGNYRYSLYDSASGQLLYRKGFSSLFEEYQGTQEAKEVQRAFPMTATTPYPIKPVRFEIDQRAYGTGIFENIFSLWINPQNYFIVHDPIDSMEVTPITDPGDPATQVDIVFLAEGYTQEEMPKFLDDAKRISDYFLSNPPFSEYRDLITFWAVESPSCNSGVDIPGKGEYKNTAFNSSFYTFDSERYLTTPDTWSMRDAAANAPYDQIIILNNSDKYGGGGFYNHYCQSTVDHEYSNIVAIHEFGHAFGGLADEYVGGVNYDGFYNLKLEPWEPNITTNIDFNSKWKWMINDSVPVPTPRESIYNDVVGMFEGGGYMAKGVYSPAMTCRMKDNAANGFCPVCQEAIREKILFYSE